MKVPAKLWKTNLKVKLSPTTWNLKEAEKVDFPEMCRRNWSIHCFLHIGGLCYVLYTVHRFGGLTLWVEFVKINVYEENLFNTLSIEGGHAAISAICSRHEPVQELGGKPRGVGGNLFISGIFYFLIFCHVKYLTSILSIIVYYRKCDETTSWRVNWTSMEKEARN